MDRRDAMKWLMAGIGSMAVPAGVSATRRRNPDDRVEGRLQWHSGQEALALATFRRRGAGAAVLYVHGATFPTSMSVAWRMQGLSWLDHLQARGFDAWSFDFAGFGNSDRPAVFQRDAGDAQPFGDAIAASAQILVVVEHISRLRPGVPIHLIAHSWGTLPAQLAAATRPDLIARLVLFGPVAMRNGSETSETHGAWHLMTSDHQRPRQRTGLPASAPTPVTEEEIERWCNAYQETDPTSASRSPRGVKVPGGPVADVARAWSGEVVVDSRRVLQPTMIVRGEWDNVTTDADARALYDALGARDKQDVKISGGNHWLHLQPRRTALWAAASSFLQED